MVVIQGVKWVSGIHSLARGHLEAVDFVHFANFKYLLSNVFNVDEKNAFSNFKI